MNFKSIPEHDEALKPQNLGPWLMKSSQSNFDLQSPSSYLACSYLIATVLDNHTSENMVQTQKKAVNFCNYIGLNKIDFVSTRYIIRHYFLLTSLH